MGPVWDFLDFLCVVVFFSEEETKRHGKKCFDSPQPDFCFGGGANLHFTPPHSKKQQKDSKIKQDIGFIPLNETPMRFLDVPHFET